MTEVAIALNTAANLIGFSQGQAKGLTDGVFRVNTFGNASFREEVPLDQLVSPVPLTRDQLLMVPGSQSQHHVYWLRYLRRGIGVTDKKRVCVEMMVRFTTFDYLPKEGDDAPTDDERAILKDYPCWGISDLNITLMSTGRGRNPFNKFNESGSLDFDVAVANDGMPYFRINYRVQHQARNILGVTIAQNHNDTGSFLVHSNGSFEINPGEARTQKHFRITAISGDVHQRPSRAAAPISAEPRANVSVLHAQDIVAGGVGQAAQPLPAYERDGLRVIGFELMNSPDTIMVSNAAMPDPVEATAADAAGHQSALRIEYVRNGAVLGKQIRTKVRVLLVLRYTLVPYLTPVDAGRRSVVFSRNVRYTGFRDVSLSVLEVGRGDPAAVGEKGAKYDVEAVKNRHHEESTLEFRPSVEEVADQVGSQIRIDWTAEHEGAALRSRAHHNGGAFRLGINQSGSPILRLLDSESNDYFTVSS